MPGIAAGGAGEVLLKRFPVREQAVLTLLERTGAPRSLIETLIREGTLLRVTYGGDTFYMRRLPSRR